MGMVLPLLLCTSIFGFGSPELLYHRIQAWSAFYPLPTTFGYFSLLLFSICRANSILGVLPAASARFLPAPYQFLMTNPMSPIIDFYPEDFKVGILIVTRKCDNILISEDMTGKKNAWEGIVLVPFIDQNRLLAACSGINESNLTPLENERNKLGYAYEMVYPSFILLPVLVFCFYVDLSYIRWAISR